MRVNTWGPVRRAAEEIVDHGGPRRGVRAFLRDMLAMPRRHVLVFLLATILLIIVEVEVIEGWHLVHLLELLGIMLVLYYDVDDMACRTNAENAEAREALGCVLPRRRLFPC